MSIPMLPSLSPAPVTPPSNSVILQQANQLSTYHSYIKDDVAYTTITLPNTTINPTIQNTTIKPTLQSTTINPTLQNTTHNQGLANPSLPTPGTLGATPGVDEIGDGRMPEGLTLRDLGRLPDGPTLRDLGRPGRRGRGRPLSPVGGSGEPGPSTSEAD